MFLADLNRMIAMYNRNKPVDAQKKFISWTSLEDGRLDDIGETYKKEVHEQDMKRKIPYFIEANRKYSEVSIGTKQYRLKLEVFVNEVFKQTMIYCPEDTGALKSSIRVRKDRDEFIMSVSTSDCPYCVTVHQNLHYKHEAPTRAKYMQDSAVEVSERYGKPYNINILINKGKIELRFNGQGSNLVLSNFVNRQKPSNNSNRNEQQDPLDNIAFESIWKE